MCPGEVSLRWTKAASPTAAAVAPLHTGNADNTCNAHTVCIQVCPGGLATLDQSCITDCRGEGVLLDVRLHPGVTPQEVSDTALCIARRSRAAGWAAGSSASDKATGMTVIAEGLVRTRTNPCAGAELGAAAVRHPTPMAAWSQRCAAGGAEAAAAAGAAGGKPPLGSTAFDNDSDADLAAFLQPPPTLILGPNSCIVSNAGVGICVRKPPVR